MFLGADERNASGCMAMDVIGTGASVEAVQMGGVHAWAAGALPRDVKKREGQNVLTHLP